MWFSKFRLLIIIWVTITSAWGQNMLGEMRASEKPLFLTPYIQSGSILEARKAAFTAPFSGTADSFSGFLTVNRTSKTHVFVWYFPAEIDPHNAPVVFSLQGGDPSSIHNAFFGNGPYQIQPDYSLRKRTHYWSKYYNMIYLDIPGFGFSFSETPDFPQNQDDIGKYMYEALNQFFLFFPRLQANSVFIHGESYAGKYVPALAHYVNLNNPNGKISNINLRGIAIGGGLIDPITMLKSDDYYFQLGLVDSLTAKKFDGLREKIVSDIKAEKWKEAQIKFNDLTALFDQSSGLGWAKNILNTKTDNSSKIINEFLNQPGMRNTLHVGNQELVLNRVDGFPVDFLKSVKPWFVEILENYCVLLYNGQFDPKRPYSTTVNFVKSIDWTGALHYRQAERKIWKVNGDIAGFSKTIRHEKRGEKLVFTEVLVRNAGHDVVGDQPQWAFQMISDFIRNSLAFVPVM